VTGTPLDPRKRPAASRNAFGACNFYIGSPNDKMRAGLLTKEAAADMPCEREDCLKTWREHHTQPPKRPIYVPGQRRY